MRRRRHAKEIDAVGALIFALDEVRAHLNRTPGRYSIPAFGEHGFPALVPIGYGWRFASHIDRVITRELTDFVRTEMRRRRQRRRINDHE